MGPAEERNVAALERWVFDVFEEGKLDLVDELIAPSYVVHGPAGTVIHARQGYAAEIESIRTGTPRLRYEMQDVIARGDRVALRYSTSAPSAQTGKTAPHESGIAIWRFEDGRLAELWHPRLPDESEPWPGAARPREQWSIASAESLTPDEEANLATLHRWADVNMNRSDDWEAMPELLADPYVTHGATGTAAGRPKTRVQSLLALRESSPGYEGRLDDVFVAGDLAAWRVRYLYRAPRSGVGSFHGAVTLYRFEEHRIAEYWYVWLPNEVGWN
jgi:predicted SnoaL-like aldol condensation-catalyzing enzyme